MVAFVFATVSPANLAGAEQPGCADPQGIAMAPGGNLSLSLTVADAQPAAAADGPETAIGDHRCPGCGSRDFLCPGKWLSGDWGGRRTVWEEDGVKLSFVLTTGFFQNFRGGLETHNANASSGDWRMNFYFDLDKLGLIPDAFFFVRGKSGWNNGIQADVGSLGPEQWVYGSTGDEEFYIDKWWYGQRFFDDRLEFRIGKLLTPADLFDIPAYAMLPWDQFSNAALGRNPTVPHRKAMGAFLKIKLSDWAFLKMGAIDADQTDSTLPADVERALHGTAAYIGLWELVVAPPIEGPKGKLPGNYAVGCWYDGRSKRKLRDELGGLLAPRYRSDDTGFYLAFDQLVWKENDDPKDKQGLGAFLRYGFADPETNRIGHFWSVGAQYQGLIEGRHRDVLALGIAQSMMSKTLRHNIDSRMDRETIYELYYAYHLTCSCIITPDIQLITNPGGSKDARDALLAGVRVRLAF